MNGKIILNLAISLDGYIADEDGGFDWIVGDGSPTLNTENKIDFPKFLEDIDVVVMGRNCYDQNFHKDYKDKDVYIATSDDMDKGRYLQTNKWVKGRREEHIFIWWRQNDWSLY